MTAAHCVTEKGDVFDAQRLMIRLGEHNIMVKAETDEEKDYGIAKVTIHSEYNYMTMNNDIAILELDKKVCIF